MFFFFYLCCFFFFFKQKTAYEMRISDWSSDVCSSDLNCRRLHLASYYLSMIEQGVGRQSMLIRNFIPGEETELRRVFMSSVHELARGFYTPEQLDAWAPVV